MAESEERIELLKELIHLGLGFEDLEKFQLGQEGKFRSRKMREKMGKVTSKVLEEQMRLKLKDEELYRKEKDEERKRERKKIEEIEGRNTRRYKNEIDRLRTAAGVAKERLRNKNKKKLKNLNFKYRERNEDQTKKIPKGLEEFAELSFMKKEKFEEIEIVKREVIIVSDGLVLSEDEKAILSLHSKFSIVEDLAEGEFEFEMEQAYSKIRMELKNEVDKVERKKTK